MKLPFKPVHFAFVIILLVPQVCRAQLQTGAALPVFEEAFVFEEGAWAEYRITEKGGPGESTLKISILEREPLRGRQARWIEISSAFPDGESAVVRLLAEETESGPGEILRAVVQPGGMDPFSVPARFLKGSGGGRFEPMSFPEDFKKETATYRGREIEVFEGIATDAESNKIKIRISPRVPPIGIVSYEGPETGMFLQDWGTGAVTEITGRPAGFFRWMASQIRNALK